MKDFHFFSLIGHAWAIASFFLSPGPLQMCAGGIGVGLIVLSVIDRVRA